MDFDAAAAPHSEERAAAADASGREDGRRRKERKEKRHHKHKDKKRHDSRERRSHAAEEEEGELLSSPRDPSRSPKRRARESSIAREESSRNPRSQGIRRHRSPGRYERESARERPPLPLREERSRRWEGEPYETSRDSWAVTRLRPGDRSRSRDRRTQSSPKRNRRPRSRSPGYAPYNTKEEEDGVNPEEEARIAAQLEAALVGKPAPQAAGEDEEQRLIEERRRRRAEILARYEKNGSATATQSNGDAGVPPPLVERQLAAQSSKPSTPSRPGSASTRDDDDDEDFLAFGRDDDDEGSRFELFGEETAGGVENSAAFASAPDASGIGEADDAELERRLSAHETAAGPLLRVGSVSQGGAEAKKAESPTGHHHDAVRDEEEDDIFAATPTDVRRKLQEQQEAKPAASKATAAPRGLLDNYDDAEGYYNFQVGEMIGPGYEVFATHGRGVFSSVLRARDLTPGARPEGATPPEVAIKVIRANETMYKAGQMEKVILRKLAEADPQNRRHCVRMLSSFEYRNHLCLVFEPLDMNLRELTKRYGRGIGLSMSAVRLYAHQMLVGLYHLRSCGILHADIKPDNILVNARRTQVKLCDFGSAMFSGDNEITPYLVSRFYRSPEIILGLSYDHPLDMWGVGCVIYELFTGHILFPGKTNNEMLKLMMDVKGPFPRKMLRRAEFGFRHFESDANMSFTLVEEDPVTKRPTRRIIPSPTVQKDVGALLAGQAPDQRRKLAQLVDLLERMLALDPDKRITPRDALRHPFIREPLAESATVS